MDRATPPRMRRQILLRDGQTCANPHCHSTARHCHHIVLRSEGGRTVPGNEISLCTTCHALVHAGLLTVTGRPGETLEWSTAAATLGRDLVEHGSTADALPTIQIPSRYPDGAIPPDPTTDGDSGHLGTVPPNQLTLPPDLLRSLVSGLGDLGFDKQTARADLLRAAAELPRGQCTEKTLIDAALEFRRERKRAARRVSGDVRIPAGPLHPGANARPDSGHARSPAPR
jgi:hypothetical protein